MPKTQKQHVISHIKRLGSISPSEALRDYQITRLAARILDLKKDGYSIESELRVHPVTGVKYARYTLAVTPVEEEPVRDPIAYRKLVRSVLHEDDGSGREWLANVLEYGPSTIKTMRSGHYQIIREVLDEVQTAPLLDDIVTSAFTLQ